MSLPTTYATSCEIHSASEIYPYHLVLYRDCDVVLQPNKVNDRTKTQKHREIVKKYTDKYPEVYWKAVKRYNNANNITNNLCTVVKNLKSLSEQIHPNLNTLHSENLTWLNEIAILTPKNNTPASINDSLLDQLPTEMEKYPSVDSVVELEDDHLDLVYGLDPVIITDKACFYLSSDNSFKSQNCRHCLYHFRVQTSGIAVTC
ncbi:ATP-dependent DNA helicase, partial [Aphis craccivora]